MAFQINSTDIFDTFESFTLSEQSSYGVTDSKFTDGSSRFKKNNTDLKTATNSTIPTSAGTYIGGSNSTSSYTVNGQAVDVALKGCRPIGIPLSEIGPGTYYLNRINNQTWLSSSPNSASGTQLSHSPKFVFLELQAGGGGGAGSGLTYAAAGGGAGGYAFTAVEIPENSYLRIVVGSGGSGGNADGGSGGRGGDTVLYDADGTALVTCYGGNGPSSSSGASGASGGSASGGIVNITGGSGGSKEHSGDAINAFTVTLPKPEQTQWQKSAQSGGSSNGNNYGGGGGASVFSAGANADSRKTPSNAGTGAGGAGAGFTAFTSSAGSSGGNGVVKIYY